MQDSKSLIERRRAVVAPGVGQFAGETTAVSAHGARLVDADGRELIDFAGGIGVMNVGHCDARVVAAVQEQAAKLLHACIHVATYEPYVALCEKLIALLPHGETTRAALFNTGAEAVENAALTARPHRLRASVVDAQGRYAVAPLGPDQKTRVLHAALATNHQGELRWPLDDQGARSLQRARYIERMLSDSSIAAAQFSDAFLAAPLYVDEHTRGAGTLYTAVYHPRSVCAEYRWPGQDVHQGLDAFEEREVTIRYASPG